MNNLYLSTMKQEQELKSLLNGQQFYLSGKDELPLARAQACASAYALATEGIAVVSDFQNGECHIYSEAFSLACAHISPIPRATAARTA